MRLTKGGSSLNSLIEKLTNKHDNISFAVAWASSGTEAFEAISNNRQKIRKSVIGTHFYQTHPEVLETYTDFEDCRFIMQPQGVFHPKVFLFWSDSSWDLLIGSANLTKGALTKNTELLLHVTSDDSDENLRLQAEQTISDYWEIGEVSTEVMATKYRNLWKIQHKYLNRISGSYYPSSESKSPFHTEIMTMTWPDFLEAVKPDPHHGYRQRCKLLSLVSDQFSTSNTFSDMALGVRKTIAGLPNDWNEHWGWFGSMRGAGYYHQAINDNNVHISAALDLIPLQGIVSYDHYLAYVEEFIQAFPNGRDGIGIASRLLTLKRPDQFVCLDSKNKEPMCKGFGIKQSGLDYYRYWDDLICRIIDSVWWNSAKPNNSEEAQVWAGRAAMLDAIFYRP